ncbi:MAG: 2-C-methyl-D-erythritol 2,4-cyclodiphosphate synthase, partial [Chthoniobacterales bacterium]
EILRRVGEILTEQNYRIANIDATLIAEAPKIGPHLEAMREKIGQALALASGQVGLKATTNEGMGAIGRDEGMAALAVASVEKMGHSA